MSFSHENASCVNYIDLDLHSWSHILILIMKLTTVRLSDAYILMTEAVTVSNLIAIASLVSEI